MCRIEVNLVIEVRDDSVRNCLVRCEELLEAAISDVLTATGNLELLPETLASDFQGDARSAALAGMYAAFSKLYRAQLIAHRARCTPPPDVSDAPDDVPELEQDE